MMELKKMTLVEVAHAASKVMWVGRATVFMVGLAVILALVLGVASAAFGANGGNFILGKTNVATLITRLAGSNGVDGAMFEVQNNNSGANDTALSLKVQAGEAPMTVNSPGKVTNLTADKVDGVDFPLSGFVQVDPPSVGAHSCVQSSVTIPGKLASDSGMLFPSRNFSAGINVTLTTHLGVGPDSADQLFYTVCNVGDTAADPPLGSWGFVIVRV
jgi:hypothetical protein